ncbi:MAG: 50S ribosomal protein L22 [bacterium]|nr:50S ribosomal protein L22 [bacterium]
MDIIAQSKFIRTSPRKLRLVARSLRGLSAQKALVLLNQMDKRAADPLAKTIKSALSNAVNNFKASAEELKIKTIDIGGGPIYKRSQPVSRGRAHEIKKRTSHIKVVLETGRKVEKVVKVEKIEGGAKK